MDFQGDLQIKLIGATAFQSSEGIGCVPAFGDLALLSGIFILDVPSERR
jgi:hypothetical protein